MTRLSNMNDPDDVLRRFEERIRNLENKNPLKNSSFEGRIRFEEGATIVAGTVTILRNGIELPWGAGRQSLRTILDAVDGRARAARDAASAAQGRADSAHNRIDTVSTRATNALNRADSAHDRITTVSGNVSYVNSRVDTVSARATNALNAANAARSRADSAYNLAAGRATTASVTAARNRADSAYSLASGRVTQAQRNALVARMNMIIAAMEVRSGYQRPPAMS